MNFTLDGRIKSALWKIASARIIFGHHSVGDNIVAGLTELAGAADIQIRFLSIDSVASSEDEPAFIHMRPGANEQPRKKIEDFASFMIEQGPFLRADVALMKLCYIDIRPETDVEELADFYIRRIGDARNALDDDIFAHVTTPVMASPSDMKARVKRVLGRPVWEDVSNKKRQDYNARILKAFPESRVFDLAGVESMAPDGSRSSSESVSLYNLWPGYTADGGHLNDLGRRIVATAFALMLEKAVDARK